MAYLDSRQFAEAIKVFGRAVEITPDSAPYHLGLGRAYLRLGNLDAARKQYNLLKAFDPGAANDLLKEIDGKPE